MNWSSQAPLNWQDCGLATGYPAIKLIDYQHSPDPIVFGKSSVRSKRWLLMNHSKAVPLRSFTEQVNISHRASPSDPWQPYFSNKFDLCAHAHPELCNGAVKPGDFFSYEDSHPPSHSSFIPHLRASEHYFVNGVFAGCAIVTYDQVQLAEEPHARGSRERGSAEYI